MSWLEERTSPWFDTVVVALVALVVAAPGLASPDRLVFDEVYYVPDALEHLELGVTTGFEAHPPLGPWLVAAGVAAVDGPLGWRIGALVMGVLGAVVLHRLSLRLLRAEGAGRLVALAPPLLLVFDGSWLVLSRTAMLDGPLTTLSLGAVAAAAAAAAAVTRARRWSWLAVAGAALGAATAVKWSGAFSGATVLAVLVLLQDGGVTTRQRVVTGATRAGAVAAVALVVYAVAWIPFAANRGEVAVETCPGEAAPCATEGGVAGVLDQHASLVRYHTGLVVADVGATPPGGWPLMQDAYGFFRPDCNDVTDPLQDLSGRSALCEGEIPEGADTIRFVGNPLVWFGFLTLAPLAAVAARRGDLAATVALVGWTAQWLPWLAATRNAYIWYMAPTIPFAALGLVAAARTVPRGGAIAAVAMGTMGGVAGAALGLVTPLGLVGGAVVGWLVGPLVLAGRATGDGDDGDVDEGRAPTVVVSTAVVAAFVAALVMRPQWVVDPDARLDGWPSAVVEEG